MPIIRVIEENIEFWDGLPKYLCDIRSIELAVLNFAFYIQFPDRIFAQNLHKWAI